MLAPGTRIGPRYIIDRLLGQGGMSNLYIATDLKQGNAVRVIKEMTARYADPAEQKMAEQLFDREATLLATLNHPHIPKVFDKFIFQGKYYLSMEYVQGEDLGKLIQDKGIIDEKSAATWGAQMATVLYYLHRQNPPIVFRDVKPSNIMIQNDQVKLIDFGIARMFTSAKKGDTMRIGSPGYAPPEQYGGQTDPRSDIYALGVTLHHAVTGYDPTISQTPFIIPPARNLNPKVSPEMEALITKATQLDSDKRYQNCLDMKRDLQSVMRAHGMQVGNSVPFSTLATPVTMPSAPTASTTPPPGATVPKLPPSQIPVAPGSAPAATPAGATTPTPAGANAASKVAAAMAATAPATPVAAPPPTVQTTTTAKAAPPKKPRKKLSLGPLLLVFAAVGLGVAAHKAPPEWKSSAAQQWAQFVAGVPDIRYQDQPVPLSDPQKAVLWGGPLGLATEALGKELQGNAKATPEQQVDYQNAIAYASGLEVRRLAVVFPADAELGATLATWQRLNWETALAEGKATVISFEAVQDDWKGALRRAQSPNRFRGDKRADGLLIFPPPTRPTGWSKWLESAPNTYLAGGRQAGDPQSAITLEIEASDFSRLLPRLGLDQPIWLSKRVPPGDSYKTAEIGALLPLLKQNGKAVVVADPDQIEQLSGLAALPQVRVVLLAPGASLPVKPPKAPKNVKLLALAQTTPFSEDLPENLLWDQAGKLKLDAIDPLSWASAQLTGSNRQSGLSWRQNRNGKLRQARWSLLEARQDQWFWSRDGGDL